MSGVFGSNLILSGRFAALTGGKHSPLLQNCTLNRVVFYCIESLLGDNVHHFREQAYPPHQFPRTLHNYIFYFHIIFDVCIKKSACTRLPIQAD